MFESAEANGELPTIDLSADLDGALRTFSAAIEDAIDDGQAMAAAMLTRHASASLLGVGAHLEALELVETTLTEMSVLDSPVARGLLLELRAGLLRGPRRYTEALRDQDEAIALLRGRVSERMSATLRHDRAVLLADSGYAEDAVTGLVAAREAFLGMRDRVGVAASDHNLAFVLHDLGAFDDAIEYLSEARDIFLAIGMPEEAASCDQNLAVVFYDVGRLKDAGRRLAVARNRFEELGASTSAGECDANLATVLHAMGQDDEAERYRSRAEQAGVRIPTAPGTSTQVRVVAVNSGGESQARGTSGSASA